MKRDTSKMEDLDLVKNIQSNKEMEDSIKSLLDHHEKLINKISYKYVVPLANSGSNIEEIGKEKWFIVYKAAMTYKEKRGTKFSSYLGSYVRWYCLNKINQNEDWKHIKNEPLDHIILEEDDKKNDVAINYIKQLLDKFEDKRVKELFELRFFSSYKLLSWNKIGKRMGGVSGQTVNNWYKKAMRVLKSRVWAEYK